MSLEYHRPQTIDEAVQLLDQGVPLAGGTVVTAARGELQAVIDLQDLGLDALEVAEAGYVFGATLTLQAMVEAADRLPQALVQACRLEAGWNIRNRASVAGTVVSADGRSPLVTLLLALGAEVELALADERIPLAQFLEDDRRGGLITAIHTGRPERLLYEQVARAPFDRPQVCVAAARSDHTRVALGGFGRHPLLLEGDDLVTAAQAAYAEADDAWASGEFRGEVAGVLTARLLDQIQAS